jgi:hypothetical protein
VPASGTLASTSAPHRHAASNLTSASAITADFVDFQAKLLPQLIVSSLPYRHQMTALLRRILLHSQHREGDKGALSTPAVSSCVFSLELRDTCLCRTRH